MRIVTRRWWQRSSPTTLTRGTPTRRGPGLSVTPMDDMPWNMHEFTLTDPSGNHVRIGTPTED